MFETCSPPTCRAALDDASEAAEGLSTPKAASASDSLQALRAMTHCIKKHGLQVNYGLQGYCNTGELADIAAKLLKTHA